MSTETIRILVRPDANTVIITGSTSFANIGSGAAVYAGASGTTQTFRRITGSGNTTVSESGNTIVIYSSGSTGGGGDYLPLSGGTLTGNLNIEKASPNTFLKTSNNTAGYYIQNSTGGTLGVLQYLGFGTPRFILQTSLDELWLASNDKIKIGNLYYATTDGNAGDVLTSDGAGNLTLQPSSSSVDAENGLSVDGGKVILGGTLDRETQIEGGNQLLEIGNNDPLAGFTVNTQNNGQIRLTSQNTLEPLQYGRLSMTSEEIRLEIADNAGNLKGFAFNTSSFLVIDDQQGYGMAYDGDYSANGANEDRWIPDNAYVKSYVSGATSGLTSYTVFTGYTATTETRLQGIENNINSLSATTSGNTADIVTLSGDVSQLRIDVDSVSGQTTGNTANISTISAATIQNAADIQAVSAVTTGHTADISTLQSQVNQLQEISTGNKRYFYENVAADVAGYESLKNQQTSTTASTESVIVGSAIGTPVLIDSYIPATGETIQSNINGGVWTFHYHASTSNLAGDSYILNEIYTRDSGGTETLHFTITGDVLTNTFDEYSVQYTAMAITGVTGHRLVSKVYGYSPSAPNRTVSFRYGGNTEFAYLDTPINIVDGFLLTTTFDAYSATTTNSITANTAAIANKADAYLTVSSITGATSLVEGDNGKMIEANGTFSLDFPSGLTTGWNVSITNVGSGTITLAAGTGATLQTKGSAVTIPNQWSGVVVYNRGSDTFVAVGDLE